MHLIPTGASLVAPLLVPGMAQAETVIVSLAQIRLLLMLGPLIVMAALGYLLLKGPFATKESMKASLDGFGQRIEPLERGYTGLRELGDSAHAEIRTLRARIEQQDQMIRDQLIASLDEMKDDQKRFLEQNATETREMRETLVEARTTLRYVCIHLGIGGPDARQG